MTFDYPGYKLNFIQREVCKDASKHLFTLIYKFFSPVTKYHYVLRAESHEGDVFAIKFYCKKDKRSTFKYSKITGKGDFGNIIITCLSVIPIVLDSYPNASFAFAGAPSVDLKSKKQEKGACTQRYLIYKYIASTVIGRQTFEHFAYDEISSYMLVNRQNRDCEETAEKLMTMFSETYLTRI